MEKKSLAESLAESYPFTTKQLQTLIDGIKVYNGFDINEKEAEQTYVVVKDAHEIAIWLTLYR